MARCVDCRAVVTEDADFCPRCWKAIGGSRTATIPERPIAPAFAEANQTAVATAPPKTSSGGALAPATSIEPPTQANRMRIKLVALGALVVIFIAVAFVHVSQRNQTIHIPATPLSAQDASTACQQKWDEAGLQSTLGDAGHSSYMDSCVAAATK